MSAESAKAEGADVGADVPGMVERVQQSLVRPGEVRRVETFFLRGVGVNLANEGEGTVEVGVPRDGADSQEGRGGKGSARVDERLENPTKLNTQLPSKQY